jgi:hypothetical protein
MFKPSSGKGVVVDPDAMTSGDISSVGNGPEWLSAIGPDRIVYTKFVPGQPHTFANARLAMAKQDTSGAWQISILSDLPRLEPWPSKDADDPAPRISYVDDQKNHYWRETDNPASEAVVPGMAASQGFALTFIPGVRAGVFLAPVKGIMQVFRYWLDTQVLEQLTFDNSRKNISAAFMWQAPEFGNDYVVAVLANQLTELRVYRQVDKSNPQWSTIYVATDPNHGTLSSPEKFVHNGKSYIFLSTTYAPNTYPSAVYLSNIDAANPMFRQLTPDTPSRSRRDPEVFVTNTGPFIYYNRVDASSAVPTATTRSEGIYRTDTGLGPAVGQ